MRHMKRAMVVGMVVLFCGCAGEYVPENQDVDNVQSELRDDNGCTTVDGQPPNYVHVTCSAILLAQAGHSASDCSRASCVTACTNCMHPATCDEAKTAAQNQARQALVSADPLAVICQWGQPIHYSCGACANYVCP